MASNEATLLLKIKQSGAEALDKVKSGLTSIAQASAVVGTAVAAFGVAAINSFMEAEEASNVLSQAMVQQGVYTSDLKAEYDKMAESIQMTTKFSDDQATAAQAVLQSQLGSIAITKELMQATVDLASAKKMDLSAAAEMVGKSIGTETNALARQGIEIDASASKTEKLAAVTDQLNAKFGGQAAAAGAGLGTLTVLKNVLDNLLETIGSKMAPFVTMVTKQLISFSTELQSNSSFLNTLDASIMFVSKTFLFFKEIIVGTVARVSGELGVLSEVLGQALHGNFSKAKDAYVTGQTEIENMMKERKAAFDQDMLAIENANEVAAEEKRQRELQMTAQAAEQKKNIVVQANQAIFTEEQKQAAALLGVKLKEKADLDKLDQAKIAARRDTFATIATMQNSNNSLLAGIGKAAAMTQIAIDTPVAIGKALAAFPPPFNFAAAGAVGAAMAVQAARVAGVQLADGGIVKATPGGIQATIGEGGRDEAVIPLENGQIPGGGGGSTIVFNGPILGDESQAMEFARAIDRNLLKLRQSNQSVAFTEDLI